MRKARRNFILRSRIPLRGINFIIIIIFITIITIIRPVRAENCVEMRDCGSVDDCREKISKCQEAIASMAKALQPHEETIRLLDTQIQNLEAGMAKLQTEINKKEKEAASRSRLAALEETELKKRVWEDFKTSQICPIGPICLISPIWSASGAPGRAALLQQRLIFQNQTEIKRLVGEITDLRRAEAKLAQDKDWLAQKKIEIDKQAEPVRKLVAEGKKYQQSASSVLAGLSVRQQQLLAEKTGNFYSTVGEVPPADDPASRPDYNPGFSPAFAGFSFGAPHRKGMSQYGAFGRAKSGQSAEDILRAYYPSAELKKDYSTGITIRVNGYGSRNIEDYVKGICEVPNSWGDNGGYEALKAQAVAARSYGLAYTNNGNNSICATEACQVYCGPKGGNWERAVNDTHGWVLTSGGQPYSSWYAASSGGYNTPGGWDTNCGNQFCWLTGGAYEKIAGSPWFYKAWYKPRNRSASRSHPWLNQEEFTDIVNAVLLYQKDSGTISHLSQTDKDSSAWNRDKIKEELRNRGLNPFDTINSVSVNYSTGGYTSAVVINGYNFDGGQFREIFNLRAPGEIWLASALFNIEKK